MSIKSRSIEPTDRGIYRGATQGMESLTAEVRALETYWQSPVEMTREMTASDAFPYSIDASESLEVLEEEALSLAAAGSLRADQGTMASLVAIGTGAIRTRKKGIYSEAIGELANFVAEVRALTAYWEGEALSPFSLKRLEAPWTFIYALTYILIIALAETLTAYFDPKLGLVLHSATMFAIFAHAAFLYPSDKRMSGFLMSIGFAPLIRIISLSAPLSPFSYIQWFLILSVPLFVGILILRYAQGLKEEDLGLTFNPRMFHWELAVGLTGFPLGMMEYLILRPGPLVDYLSIQTMLTPVLIMMICTGLIEELIFRGLIQHNSIRVFGPWRGMLFSALLFSCLHIGNLSLVSIAFAFGVGFGYSLVVRHTKSIVGVSISHGLINVMLFLVMPLYF